MILQPFQTACNHGLTYRVFGVFNPIYGCQHCAARIFATLWEH